MRLWCTGDGGWGLGNLALVLRVYDWEVEAGKVDVEVQVVRLLCLCLPRQFGSTNTKATLTACARSI